MNLPAAVQAVAGPVGERLRRLLDDERTRWAGVDAELAVPFGALAAYVLSGGKRLRPAFCYWSYVGAGGDPGADEVVNAGAALEMLHAAALIHDDILDGSRLRHDSDTVHVSLAGHHRAHGWSGGSDRFGEGGAILVGDLALVYSSRLMAGAPADAAGVFEEMRLEVNVGQYLDILGAAQGVDLPDGRAAERARRICRYKTAKYTVERPLQLGAALAGPGCLEALATPLSDFGLPLGEAFQLKDDLLGVFGDPTVTGKPVGDDLREGKPTLLASLAVAAAPPADQKRFAALFGDPSIGPDEVAELQAVIVDSGAKAHVEAAIEDLAARANAALAALPVTLPARQALGELAAFVTGRNR